jgi:ferrous iron transport protein B
MPERGEGAVHVALTGQPNVGKSTVFNLLTGLNQHVGNWPGKTVEQKTGTCQLEDRTLHLVDLPGTYSLSASSPEELIAREYIIKEKPDVVVAIVNAATLERSLYLISELLPLPVPLVIGLNMIDVAEQNGWKIEPHVLEAALGVPVVPMIATKGQGIRELLERIGDIVCDTEQRAPSTPRIREDHEHVLARIEELLDGHVPNEYPQTWVALKLLEGDQQITEMLQPRLPENAWAQINGILAQHEDACVAIASARYEWIARMVRAAVVRPRAGQITLTDRLDRWVTHPLWGLVGLAAILAVAFWLTYAVGLPLTEWVDRYVVQAVADLARRALAWAPGWLISFAADGIIGSVGAVLSFFPILLIFFAILAILEDVGYMARAAYLMDRFMHVMGLHGKSFLPLFLGFGCNVPAVMGARVIESQRARLLTILLAPFVPCSGRMAAIAFLAPVFFSAPAVVTWVLLMVNLVVLAIAGLLLNRVVLRGEQAPFVMELPLYHLPNWRSIALAVWHRLLSFVQKAGTVILLAAVVVWVLATLPNGSIDSSWLAGLGRLLEPSGVWMGLDWRMMVALLSGIVAKENVIATLGLLFGAAASGTGLRTSLHATFTPAAGLAFMVIQMLFIPCVGTVGAIRQETDSWKWTIVSILLQLMVSLVGGVLAYRLALLIGW